MLIKVFTFRTCIMQIHVAYDFNSSLQRVKLISDRSHVHCALSDKNTLVVGNKVHINCLKNCQSKNRSNPWIGQTLTDEFKSSKSDCNMK